LNRKLPIYEIIVRLLSLCLKCIIYSRAYIALRDLRMFHICYSWNFKSTTDFTPSFNEYFCYFASPRWFISCSAFITRTWIEVLPQLNKMFSKCFRFVILTVISLLLQGTFSVVYNMHLRFIFFQTRSHFRAESNLIISGNDYKSKLPCSLNINWIKLHWHYLNQLWS
jgi:hypothetical protein